MSLRICAGVFLGLALVTSAGAATEASLAGHGAVQLIRGSENHLLAPASVNGHPASFLLDTGENLTFLQNDRAAALGAHNLGRQTNVGALWFSLAQIDRLGIGTVMLSPVEVALYDPTQFRGPVPGRGGKAADGILGLDLLQRHGAVINCRTQQLFIQSDTAKRLDLASTTAGLGFTRIPITPSGHGQLTVPCSIGSVSGRLVVDTGAPVTVFDANGVRALNLKKETTSKPARTASGRIRPMALSQIEGLKIGNLPIATQKFAIMELFDPNKAVRVFTPGIVNRLEYYDGRIPKSKHDVLGLLGSELLYQHSAIIDLSGMSLYLK